MAGWWFSNGKYDLNIFLIIEFKSRQRERDMLCLHHGARKRTSAVVVVVLAAVATMVGNTQVQAEGKFLLLSLSLFFSPLFGGSIRSLSRSLYLKPFLRVTSLGIRCNIPERFSRTLGVQKPANEKAVVDILQTFQNTNCLFYISRFTGNNA